MKNYKRGPRFGPNSKKEMQKIANLDILDPSEPKPEHAEKKVETAQQIRKDAEQKIIVVQDEQKEKEVEILHSKNAAQENPVVETQELQNAQKKEDKLVEKKKK